MHQNKIIVPTVPKIAVPIPNRPLTPTAIGKQEEIIRIIGEVREDIRGLAVNNNDIEQVQQRIHQEYQNIIRQMRREHEEEVIRMQREYQNNIQNLIQEQQNVVTGMIRQHENNIGVLMRGQQTTQEQIEEVRREIEGIRRAVVPEEPEEEEEEISTTGGNRITKERGQRLSEEEIRILLNRIAKNITTYQQKYTNGEREEQIRNMRETQQILREIQEERRRVKRGTGIKA